jgi:hypothetical protein
VRADPACDTIARDRERARDRHATASIVLIARSRGSRTARMHTSDRSRDPQRRRRRGREGLLRPGPRTARLRADDGLRRGAGFAADGKPDFFLATRRAELARCTSPSEPRPQTVDAFHEAPSPRRHGQRPAGIRRVYHEYYYGAYVLDPEGNNIEAVTHDPE